MITHCYLYRLHDRKKIQEATEMLLTMKQQISCISSIEVGLDFSHSENAYDLVQLTRFENDEAFEIFKNHPIHEEIRLFFQSICLDAIKVDFIS